MLVRGRPAQNRFDEDFRKAVMELVKDTYFDFNMRHALEKLEADHGIEVNYYTFRRWCHAEKLVKRCKRRKGIKRSKRTRMPSEGLLLQMDGSPHRYNGVDKWCLIGAIDDATSDIPYAEFFLSEDTLNCMTVLQKIIEKKGLPHAIYVDAAGCFGGGKRAHFNRFQRACEELNIRIIIASSPQAKGRIERAWDTIQDRIIPEMRLRNIRRMPTANDYLQNHFLPDYWKSQNTVVAKSPEKRYTKLSAEIDLREILCLKDTRLVKRDHTLSWEGKTYRLKLDVKYSIYKQQIELRTYQDLTWKAYYCGREVQLIPYEEPLKACA